MRAVLLLVGALACASTAPAIAQLTGPGHLDVLLSSEPGPTPGSIKIGLGYLGDLNYYLPGATQLQDSATGYNIYPGKFGEFPGGQGSLVTGSDDPGFQAVSGEFGSRESFLYRAMGPLLHWSPATGAWQAPTGGEGVVLFGNLPQHLSGCVLLNPPAGLNCPFYQGGTRFRAQGIIGPVDELLVGRTSTTGGFHDHLDWFLEDTAGAPPATGAYLVQLQLYSDAKTGGAPKYMPSDPFFVMFNHGLTDAEFSAAMTSRVTAVPEPATVLMLIAGLAGVIFASRRRTRR